MHGDPGRASPDLRRCMEQSPGPLRPARAAAQRRPVGHSVPTLSALLQACADSPTARRPGGDTPTEALKIASPDNPVTWDIADDNQPDRRRPAAGEGPAAPLQLRRLHRSGGREGVREEVRRRRQGLDLQRHRRGADEDPRRCRAVRHLLPELRPDRPDGDRQAHPAAQPQLHRQHRQRVAEFTTLVRRRVAVLRALQRLHDRDRLARPTGSPTTSPRSTTPTTLCGTPTYRGKVGDHRRLAHRDGDGRPARRASPTSTATKPKDLEVIQKSLTEMQPAPPSPR